MLDQTQLLNTLQQLMQKTRGADNAVSMLSAPPPPVQPLPSQAKPQIGDQSAPSGIPTLGFLGGLGDTPNPVTGVSDPSILTKLNQYLMNQSSQANMAQQLPWQTTPSQQNGQDITKIISSALKFFGM